MPRSRKRTRRKRGGFNTRWYDEDDELQAGLFENDKLFLDLIPNGNVYGKMKSCAEGTKRQWRAGKNGWVFSNNARLVTRTVYNWKRANKWILQDHKNDLKITTMMKKLKDEKKEEMRGLILPTYISYKYEPLKESNQELQSGKDSKKLPYCNYCTKPRQNYWGDSLLFRLQQFPMCLKNKRMYERKKYGWAGTVHVHTEEFLKKINNKDPKDVLKSCAQVFKTIFELHKNNIAYMNIYYDNIYFECEDTEDTNSFALASNGFKMFDTAEEMFTTEVNMPEEKLRPFYSWKKGEYTFQGGPATDYYAWLKVFLSVYNRLLHKKEKLHKREKNETGTFKSEMALFEKMNYVNPIEAVTKEGEKKGKLNKAVESWMHTKDKKLVKLMLEALAASAKDELYDMAQNEPNWGGEHLFYDKYIKPIVEFFDSPEYTKEVFHKVNMLGFGGSKRRKRTKKKKRRRRRKRTRK